ARASLNRWPSRPNPVTSVAHLIPAASARRLASAFSVVITSIASARTWPVALCQSLSTPVPRGLVRRSGHPGWRASSRSHAAGSRHRPGRAHPHHGAVVAMLDTHHQVRARAIGHQPGYGFLQLARRDLAGAATAARILGEPEGTRTGHAVKCSARPKPPVGTP